MNREMKSGVSESGFIRKTYIEIRKEIEHTLSGHLGKLNFADNTVFGQIVAIFSEREALLWEKLAQVYHSQYPDTAEGYSLDGACALLGIKRLNATYSTVRCQLTAVNYTTIPKGSEVAVENTNSLFALIDTTVISNERCQSIRLRFNASRPQIFRISINSHAIAYQSSGNQTSKEISEQLINQLKKIDIKIKAELVDEDILITSVLVDESFSCFVSEGILIVSCTNNALFRAKNKGNITAPSCAVNIIQTPVYGWMSVSNINAAVIGRNLENDQELKVRRKLSLNLSGSGTVESIRARLMALNGIATVALTENNTDKKDSAGRPPQSFEALVLGGEDLNIAEVIWLAKPAGIQAWGNQTIIIKDSSGKKQAIKFSRPTKKYVHAHVKLKVAEHFNLSSIKQIKQTVVDYINQKGINEGLIFQSLFVPVYSSVGIMNADIKIGGSLVEGQNPELNNIDIEAQAAEILVTDLNKIIVEVI